MTHDEDELRTAYQGIEDRAAEHMPEAAQILALYQTTEDAISTAEAYTAGFEAPPVSWMSTGSGS